jgi:methylenetetrahydrofolate reductase (NADPH)
MKIIDIINQAAEQNKPRFTFELLPPLKGEGTAAIFEAIDTLAPLDPAYINVTFHREDTTYTERAGGLLERRTIRHRPGTVGISAAIARKYGIETVPHIICGDLSRYDIEDALIDMDFLGMHNVLALRGDARRGENRFEPHPQGHAHADGLVAQIADMNRGKFLEGDGAQHTDFCIGVAGYPEKHAESPNLDADMEALRRKVDAGADYIVTQMSFDNARILDFVDRARKAGINVPIVPGIKPLATKSHLTVLPQTFHVDLPTELVREVEKCRDNAAVREVGIEWAAQQAAGLKKAGLPVIHFYSMGRTTNIEQIVKKVF